RNIAVFSGHAYLSIKGQIKSVTWMKVSVKADYMYIEIVGVCVGVCVCGCVVCVCVWVCVCVVVCVCVCVFVCLFGVVSAPDAFEMSTSLQLSTLYLNGQMIHFYLDLG